jgi:putative ABC transport system permease protein
MLSHLRYSLRQLLKAPGFTITAIVILGFSIGLSTAIFSLIDAVMLKPLPFPNSERLVEVDEPHHNHPHSVFDYPDYVDTVAAQHTFDSLGLKREITLDLQTKNGAKLVEADFASPSLFNVTGLPVILGRRFTDKEDIRNGPQVAVLSERCWRSRFQSDPNVLDKNIILNDLSFQVIGVVPSQLDDWGPPGVDLYLPLHTIVPFKVVGDPFAQRNIHWFTCFGRLKAGVSISEAETELKTIHENLLSHYPGVNIGYGLRIFPLLGFMVEGYSTTIWLLAAAVCLLLIVSCLNVGNLLFARGLHRRREMTIRATLGASRWRVLGRLLWENILLTAIGGLLGLVVASVCIRSTKNLIPADLYRLQELQVDTNALVFIFVLILITSLLAGLLPAWSLSQVTLAPSLNEGGRSGSGGPHRHRIQSALVTAQVALTCILLIGAGLLLRSFYATQTVELGFNPNHLLVAEVNLAGAKYEEDDTKVRTFWDELITKIRRVPGVTEATLNNNPPLTSDDRSFSLFTVDGQPLPEPDQEPILDLQKVSSDYFRTMQIPLLLGRDFDSHDTADKANVVLVDSALVKQYFPDQNPIGKTLNIGEGGGNYRNQDHPPYTIVGVVPHLCHDTPGEWQVPFQAYHPLAQTDSLDECLVVRSNLSPSTLGTAIRQAVDSIDSGVPIFNVHPYDEVIALRFVTRRLSTLLLVMFSSAALFLAAVGLYGILSYFVSQKSREIGIRIAVGAPAGNIFRLVAAQGLWPVGVGLTIGILAGLLLARFIEDFLYGVYTYDPITLIMTALVLGGSAVAACLLPAGRAIRIDPVRVLSEQ